MKDEKKDLMKTRHKDKMEVGDKEKKRNEAQEKGVLEEIKEKEAQVSMHSISQSEKEEKKASKDASV